MGGWWRVTLAIALVLLAACDYRVARDPQVLVRYLGGDPSSLNPITANESSQTEVNAFVYETLLKRNNRTLAIEPLLAERWEETPDHLEFTFLLRDGVRWHDGQPFTSADVVFSFERINDPKVGAAHLSSYFTLAGIARCAAVDARTVRFSLDRPYFKALEVVGGMPIVAKHLFEGADDFRAHPVSRAPIGTGPMRFAEWKTARRIRLVRNSDYWGTPMALTGVTFSLITDQWVAFQILKKGQLDHAQIRFIQWMKQTGSRAFAARFHKDLIEAYTSGYSYIGWNNRHPIFGDRQVRQAMTMLIDRERMAQKFFFGMARVGASTFYEGGAQHDPAVTPWRYDPTRAVALLEEAGWIDHDGDGVRDRDGHPLEFTILYPGPSRWIDSLTNIMREDLRKLGIVVNVRTMEGTVYLKTIQDHQYDAFVGAWTGEAESDPHQLWHSSQYEKGSNFIGFADPEVDRLIDAARVTFDAAARNAMYRQMDRIIHEAQPYTFLFVNPERHIRHRRFTNVQIYPAGYDFMEWGVGESEALTQ